MACFCMPRNMCAWRSGNVACLEHLMYVSYDLAIEELMCLTMLQVEVSYNAAVEARQLRSAAQQ
jgi:hypothetical protein